MLGILNRYRLLEPSNDEPLCKPCRLKSFKPFLTSIILDVFEMWVISTKCKKRKVKRSRQLVDYFYRLAQNFKFWEKLSLEKYKPHVIIRVKKFVLCLIKLLYLDNHINMSTFETHNLNTDSRVYYLYVIN